MGRREVIEEISRKTYPDDERYQVSPLPGGGCLRGLKQVSLHDFFPNARATRFREQVSLINWRGERFR